jgi:hypothetical protein
MPSSPSPAATACLVPLAEAALGIHVEECDGVAEVGERDGQCAATVIFPEPPFCCATVMILPAMKTRSRRKGALLPRN